MGRNAPVRAAFGDLLAVVHDHDMVGKAHDEAHVVLDQQDGDAERGDAHDQFGQALGFGVVETGGGFVHQQQARAQREGARDFHQALVAEWQGGGIMVVGALQAYETSASAAWACASRAAEAQRIGMPLR